MIPREAGEAQVSTTGSGRWEWVCYGPNWFSNPVPFTIPLDIISVAREKDEGRVYEKSAGVFVYECRVKVETVMVHQKGE